MKQLFFFSILFFYCSAYNSQSVNSINFLNGQINVDLTINGNQPNVLDFNFVCSGSSMPCFKLDPVDPNILVDHVAQVIDIPAGQPNSLSLVFDYSICTIECESPEIEFSIAGSQKESLLGSLDNVQDNFPNLIQGQSIGISEDEPTNSLFIFQCQGEQGVQYNFELVPQLIGNTCWTDFENSNWLYRISDGMNLVNSQDGTFMYSDLCQNNANDIPINLDGNDAINESISEGQYLILYNCSLAPCGDNINNNMACTNSCDECSASLNLNFVMQSPLFNSMNCLNGSSVCPPEDATVSLKQRDRRIEILRILPEGKVVDEFTCLTADTDMDNYMQWEYQIRNIGDHKINEFYLVFREFSDNSHVRLFDFELIQPNNTLSSWNWNCPDISDLPLSSQGEFCNDFKQFISRLDDLESVQKDPNEFYTLRFKSKRCRGTIDYCDSRRYNEWRILAYSYCDDSCVSSIQTSNGACSSLYNPNNCSPESADNLLNINYSAKNGSAIEISTSSIGGNAGSRSDFDYLMTPIQSAGNIYGDICQTSSPGNFKINISGKLPTSSSNQSISDLDIFNTQSSNTKHLVRARFFLDEGLTLHTWPKIYMPADLNGSMLSLVKAFRVNDAILPWSATSCSSSPNSGGLVDACWNLTNPSGVPTCNSSNVCPNGNCPIDCSAYGQMWEVYFEIQNGDIDDFTQFSDLRTLFSGILEFDVLGGCACLTDGESANQKFEIQIDYRPLEYDSFNCDPSSSSFQNKSFAELDQLTWLPIGKIGDLLSNSGDCNGVDLDVNVQCPGCKTPGVIACNYSINRTSIGELDINNDGRIDDCQNSALADENLIARNTSIYGDIIEDQLSAFFQDGDNSGVNSTPSVPGFTYQDLINYAAFPNADKPFKFLQLQRDFGSNVKTPFDLNMTSCSIEIFRNAQNCSSDPAALQKVIEKTFSQSDLLNILQENGDQFLLTFGVGTASYELGHELNSGIQYEFNVNDLFRINCTYKVASNKLLPQNPPQNLGVSQVRTESDINNLMWFSRNKKLINEWTNSAENQDCLTNNCNANLCPCSAFDFIFDENDDDQDNSFVGANWQDGIFWCEATSGSHYFVGIGTQNVVPTNFVLNQNDCENCDQVDNECKRTIILISRSYIGNGQDDLFPYEIRIPPMELKFLNTENLNAFGWDISEVRSRSNVQDCSHFSLGSKLTNSYNQEIWDINRSLNYQESGNTCNLNNQVEDNFIQTRLEIDYTPQINANSTLVCSPAIDNWPKMNFDLNSDPNAEEMLFYDHLDMNDNVMESGLFNGVFNCSGLNTQGSNSATQTNNLWDCCESIELINGSNTSNCQNIFTGTFGLGNLDDTFPSLSQPVDDIVFSSTNISDYAFNQVCWNLKVFETSVSFLIPDQNITCLDNWGLYDSNNTLLLPEVVSSQDGLFYTFSDLNIGDDYALCADIIGCDCHNGPVTFNLFYGLPCGCELSMRTCTDSIPLTYGTEEFNGAFNAVECVTDCNDCQTQTQIDFSLSVNSGSLSNLSVKIPYMDNVLPSAGTISINGQQPIDLCDATISNGFWNFIISENCSSTTNSLRLLSNDLVSFSICFDFLCNGNYTISPIICGVDACNTLDFPLDQIQIEIEDLTLNPCNPCEELSISSTPNDCAYSFAINYSDCIPSNIVWDFGDGNSQIGGLTASHSYADNFSGSVQVSLDCGDTNCIVSESISTGTCSTCTATINANVNIDCLGSFYIQNLNSACSNLTYLWTFHDGSTSNLADPTYAYQENDTYPIDVVIYCDNQIICSISSTVSTLDCIKPCNAFDIIPYADENCNYSFSIDLQGLINPDDYEFIWWLDGGEIIQTANPTVSYSYNSTDFYDQVCFTLLDPIDGYICKHCEDVWIGCLPGTPTALECTLDKDDLTSTSGKNYGRNVFLNQEGELVLLGTKHQSHSDADAYLGVYSEDLNPIFSTRLGEVTGSSEYETALNAVESNDHYYVLSSLKDPKLAEHDIVLSKIKSIDGTLVWSKRFDLGRNDVPVDILISNDEQNMIVVGHTNNYSSAAYYEIFFLRISFDGVVLDSKAFGNTSKSEFATDAIRLTNGDGYLVVGEWRAGQGRDGIAMRISDSFNMLGHRIYRANGHERLQAVEAFGDHYFAVGYANNNTTDKDIWILEFDNTLDVHKSELFGNNHTSEWAFGVEIDANGNAFICGQEKEKIVDGFVLKKNINSSNDFDWYQRSVNAFPEDKFLGLTEHGNDLYLTGYYEDNVGNSEIELVKMSKEGVACCLYMSSVVKTDFLVNEVKLSSNRSTSVTSIDYGGQDFQSDMSNLCAEGEKFNSLTTEIEDKDLFIIPNPSSGFFELRLQGASFRKIHIVDGLGSVVYESQFRENELNSSKVDLSNLESGMYFIRVIDTDNHLYHENLVFSK
ncbi:MAG: T9SS type A sorting domain-containing protein [Bacteroidota bacterium]